MGSSRKLYAPPPSGCGGAGGERGEASGLWRAVAGEIPAGESLRGDPSGGESAGRSQPSQPIQRAE